MRRLRRTAAAAAVAVAAMAAVVPTSLAERPSLFGRLLGHAKQYDTTPLKIKLGAVYYAIPRNYFATMPFKGHRGRVIGEDGEFLIANGIYLVGALPEFSGLSSETRYTILEAPGQDRRISVLVSVPRGISSRESLDKIRTLRLNDGISTRNIDSDTQTETRLTLARPFSRAREEIVDVTVDKVTGAFWTCDRTFVIQGPPDRMSDPACSYFGHDGNLRVEISFGRRFEGRRDAIAQLVFDKLKSWQVPNMPTKNGEPHAKP